MSSISVPDVMTPCAVTLLRIARKLPAGVNAARKVRRRAGVVARAASDSSVQTFFAAKKLPELSNRTVQQNCPTELSNTLSRTERTALELGQRPFRSLLFLSFQTT